MMLYSRNTKLSLKLPSSGGWIFNRSMVLFIYEFENKSSSLVRISFMAVLSNSFVLLACFTLPKILKFKVFIYNLSFCLLTF